MDIVYWVFIGIVAVALLFGLKNFLGLFAWSWGENGSGYTVKMILFFILLFAPGVVKMYEPDYYGIAIWIFILYSLFLIAFRFTIGNRHKNQKDF